MTWILQRGPSEEAAPKGDCLLRWGPPPLKSPGRTIVCWIPDSNHGKAEVVLCEGSVRKILPCEELPTEVACEIEPGVIVRWFRLEWWDSEVRVVLSHHEATQFWIPAQEWQDDRWYDGPLACWLRGGVHSWVGAGSCGTLEISGLSPLNVATDQSSPFALVHQGQSWKLSLSLGLRLRMGSFPGQAVACRMSRYDACELAMLVIFRVMHPTFEMYIDGGTKGLPSAWRRVLQNLNVQLRWPPRCEPLLTVDMTTLWPHAVTKHFSKFLVALQMKVPCIPEKLLASLVAEV